MSTSTELLEAAWQGIVAYRQQVHTETGVFRSHLVDLDLWGVLVESADEGVLRGTPREVMDRVLAEQRQPVLPDLITDPAQEIYEAIVEMLTTMEVLP